MADAVKIRRLAANASDVDLEPVDPDREVHVAEAGEYVVAHNGLGVFCRGDIVSGKDLASPENVKRLLDLGAIVSVPFDGKEPKAK